MTSSSYFRTFTYTSPEPSGCLWPCFEEAVAFRWIMNLKKFYAYSFQNILTPLRRSQPLWVAKQLKIAGTAVCLLGVLFSCCLTLGKVLYSLPPVLSFVIAVIIIELFVNLFMRNNFLLYTKHLYSVKQFIEH